MKPLKQIPDNLRQVYTGLVIRLYQDLEQYVGNGKKPSITAIAQRLNVSTATLSRACLAIYQKSPLALKQQFLMERAKEQIQSGTKPIAIYQQYGYKTYNGFAKAFSKAINFTPITINRHINT